VVSLEEHFFRCAHCTGQLEGLVALAAGVRTAVKDGRVTMVVSEPFVDAIGRRACAARIPARVRRQRELHHPRGRRRRRVAPARSACRCEASRRRARAGRRESEARVGDVPFDAQTGEVLMIPSAAWLKTMPVFTMRMRLIAVGEAGEDQIGEYTFNHSPS
jgi:hypothetical protein